MSSMQKINDIMKDFNNYGKNRKKIKIYFEMYLFTN